MYVNQIHIAGNNKTRDEVIRRELRQMEAAPYDTSKLNRSKNNSIMAFPNTEESTSCVN